MVKRAGHHVTAADLGFDMDGTTLVDDTAAAASTWEQWGTETITFANPGIAVKIKGTATGRLENVSNTDSNGGARVAISIDGGSTFTVGNAPIVNMGTSVGTRNGVASEAYRAGTPSGDIVIKVEFIVSTINIQAKDGYLTATLLPQ